MEEFKLNYNKVVFLSAYLRQMDLSLDRSRWTPLNELKNYYNDVINPEQVINYLKKEFVLKEEDFQAFITPACKKTLKTKIKVAFSKKIVLSKNEILLLFKLLKTFKDKLNSNIEEYSLEFEKLRIDVANYYSSVFEPILLKKDLEKVTRVEHYFQNLHIEVTGMNEFITDDFPIKS